MGGRSPISSRISWIIFFGSWDSMWGLKIKEYTLQGINISYLGKRDIIFKSAFSMGYVSSQEGIWTTLPQLLRQKKHIFRASVFWTKVCEGLKRFFTSSSSSSLSSRRSRILGCKNRYFLTFGNRGFEWEPTVSFISRGYFTHILEV